MQELTNAGVTLMSVFCMLEQAPLCLQLAPLLLVFLLPVFLFFIWPFLVPSSYLCIPPQWAAKAPVKLASGKYLSFVALLLFMMLGKNRK